VDKSVKEDKSIQNNQSHRFIGSRDTVPQVCKTSLGDDLGNKTCDDCSNAAALAFLLEH
jgi:hypothetical protein